MRDDTRNQNYADRNVVEAYYDFVFNRRLKRINISQYGKLFVIRFKGRHVFYSNVVP